MAMASQSKDVKQAVIEACAALPADVLEDYQALAMFSGRGGDLRKRTSDDQAVQPGSRSLGPESMNTCAICIGEIECDDPITALPCGHCYHSTCVHIWLRQSGTCPICRSEVRR